MDDENLGENQARDQAADQGPGNPSNGGTAPTSGPRRPGLFRPRNIVIASVFGVVVAVIAVVAVLVLAALGSPGEATAEFLPADTQAYFTINLLPGAGQISKALKIESILEKSGDLDNRRQDYLDSFEEETGIDVRNDVMPWLGKDITFALLDAYADDGPEWVGMVQTSDREATESFLLDLVRYLEDTQFQLFEVKTRQDAKVWVEDFEGVSFGLTDEYVLFGATEGVINQTIDDLESPPTLALNQNEDYLRVRDRLPKERSMLLFVNAKDLIAGAEEASGLSDFFEFGAFEESVPDSLMVSASFIDNGLRLDVVGDTALDSFVLETMAEFGMGDSLPQDTLFMVAAAGGKEGWEQLRESLEDTDGDVSQQLDQWLAELKEISGIDLEQDVIEELNGYMALALLPSEFQFDENLEGLESGTIEVVLLADLDDTLGLRTVAEDLMETVREEYELDLPRTTSGKYEIVTLDLSSLGEETAGFNPGYVFSDNLVALGSTEQSLLKIVNTITGGEQPLSSDEEFDRLSKMAPEDASAFIYADIAGIVAMMVDAMPSDAAAEYDRDVAPFVEPFSAFFLAAAATEEFNQYTLILTVQEQE